MTNRTPPATHGQRALIDLWGKQLDLTDLDLDHLAQDHGAPSIDAASCHVARAVIMDLVTIKQHRQRRPA